MNQTHIDLLKENLSILNLSLNRLMYSHNVCNKIGIKNKYTEEEFVEFEAMTSRYARTTDMFVNKVLRNIDTVESEDIGTIIDIMNRAEKRNIVESAELLHTIKDLRNNIALEYEQDKIMLFFKEVLTYTPKLREFINNVNKYCEKYIKKDVK